MDHYFNEKEVALQATAKIGARAKSDLLVLYAYTEKESVHIPGLPKEWDEQVHSLLQLKDFKAETCQEVLLYGKHPKEPRLLLVGLGKKKEVTCQTIRLAFAACGRTIFSKGYKHISCYLPTDMALDPKSCIREVVFALQTTQYSFGLHKGTQEKTSSLKKITLIGCTTKALETAKLAQCIVRGVDLSRDLINTNADEMNPQGLASVALSIAKQSPKVKATIRDKKWIEKQGMGLLLAVNQGSHEPPPAFITLEYKGAAKSREHIVLIGKGITYDTGGLNLKPTGSMESMKSDMSGAAIVLATLYTAAKLSLPLHITAVVPTTENAVGPKSFKPGDVYTSHKGITVEIGNTDAEGRLILADALSWSEENLKPTCMLDVATLTGAMAIALGSSCAGYFSNDEKLIHKLNEASHNSGEKLWQMPLVEEYKEHLASYVADTSNIGKREGGAITAALFLEKFVEKTPWAHLDVAGTTFTKFTSGVYPKHATGYGVKLLVEFLQSYA